MNSNFWQGKKVLVTGHTGFKGSWISLWLQHLGADVIGYALNPPTSPNLFEQADVAENMLSINGDIRDLESVKIFISKHQPEIIFHLAAQPLVRYSYKNPVETYETNVMGTLNILEAIRCTNSVRAAVMVTTDKCYDNKEWLWAYRENEAMGGYDPYSSSKGCAELLIASYRNSYFSAETYSHHQTSIASVRAGNVIGGGDWAEDRLVPDIIKSVQNNKVVNIRNPGAIRPWQHVLEPLSGYLILAEKLYTNGVEYAQAWNFGPLEEDTKTVGWIAQRLTDIWGRDSHWKPEEDIVQLHEANYLKLDCSKAHNLLLWWPKWNLELTLKKIVHWHKIEINGGSLKEISIEQIKEYSSGKV